MAIFHSHTHEEHGHSHSENCGCHSHGHHHEEHSHEHHHEEHGIGRQIGIIALSTVLLGVAIWIEHHGAWTTWQLLLAYLVPYLLAGHETLGEAIEGIRKGEMMNEHFLMAVATIGALCIGFMPEAETEFAEAVAVMLFFQVGELFEGYAEHQSRKSINHLMALRPDKATVVRDGEKITVKPDEVAIGETIVVRPGERIPIDGIVAEGSGSIDTVALTGESVPRKIVEGDEALSGCINLSGVLRIKTTKGYGESTVARIIDMVENAGEHKSKSEAFITRFARVYTPIVVYAALALALLPPLVMGDFAGLLPVWLHRALIFLVVSCPCALVISVPLTFFGGIGGASRNGILVKGANYMDALAKVGTVVFDKTGTLTKGCFAVTAVHPEKCDERHLLHLAAHVERYSTHPIAIALRQAFPEEGSDGCKVEVIEEIAGHGIRAKVGDWYVSVGNGALMEREGATWHECHKTGTVVHVAIDGVYAGHIVISDSIKEDSATAIRNLKDLNINTVMLTGDRKATGDEVARHLGIDEWHTGLLPADKVGHVERLLESITEGRKLAFVGDGINDAPVLARADIGIAMGALGSEAAIESADVVLMDDQPSKVGTAIKIARRTLRIARENVVFAIGVKVVVLALAALGIATMWMAAFADVGVTVIAVLNAMRALAVSSKK